jgi:hypothetical protein
LKPTAGLAIAQAARESGQAQKAYSPARTPWGDPDLQGTYTNKYEQSTPLERPDEFSGRRVEDVAGAELANVLAKRNTQVIERAAGVGPLQFRDTLDVTKGSRAWLIVDPPDGRIPPMTTAARQRIGPPDPFQDAGIQGIVNARVRGPSSFDTDSPFKSMDDLDLWERCITRGVPGAMMPHILGNSYEIVQAPALSPSATSSFTTCASSRSMAALAWPKRSSSRWATVVAIGKAMRWWSNRRITRIEAHTGTPTQRRCGWSSASPEPRPTKSSGL